MQKQFKQREKETLDTRKEDEEKKKQALAIEK